MKPERDRRGSKNIILPKLALPMLMLCGGWMGANR